MIPLAVILFVVRTFLVLIAAETSVRYFFWWRLMAVQRPPEPLAALMLGIAVLNFGLAGGTAWAIWHHVANEFSDLGGIGPVTFDLAVIGGVSCHLAPAWRLTCGFGMLRIVLSYLARAAFAIGAGLALWSVAG